MNLLGLARGGRPRAHDNRSTRLKHIRCAYYKLVLGRSPRWLMSRYRCSARTVQLWCNAALTYTDDEAKALRGHLARAAA